MTCEASGWRAARTTPKCFPKLTLLQLYHFKTSRTINHGRRSCFRVINLSCRGLRVCEGKYVRTEDAARADVAKKRIGKRLLIDGKLR
jgi:hypothetical protein